MKLKVGMRVTVKGWHDKIDGPGTVVDVKRENENRIGVRLDNYTDYDDSYNDKPDFQPGVPVDCIRLANKLEKILE